MAYQIARYIEHRVVQIIIYTAYIIILPAHILRKYVSNICGTETEQ